ncbi:MAG: hypothetical protein ACYC3G_03715 [Minisyncoccota bacterium]
MAIWRRDVEPDQDLFWAEQDHSPIRISGTSVPAICAETKWLCIHFVFAPIILMNKYLVYTILVINIFYVNSVLFKNDRFRLYGYRIVMNYYGFIGRYLIKIWKY